MYEITCIGEREARLALGLWHQHCCALAGAESGTGFPSMQLRGEERGWLGFTTTACPLGPMALNFRARFAHMPSTLERKVDDYRITQAALRRAGHCCSSRHRNSRLYAVKPRKPCARPYQEECRQPEMQGGVRGEERLC